MARQGPTGWLATDGSYHRGPTRLPSAGKLTGRVVSRKTESFVSLALTARIYEQLPCSLIRLSCLSGIETFFFCCRPPLPDLRCPRKLPPALPSFSRSFMRSCNLDYGYPMNLDDLKDLKHAREGDEFADSSGEEISEAMSSS